MDTGARRAWDLMGLPVLGVADGQRLGEISALLVRREDRSVVAVGIGGGVFAHPRYIGFSQLKTIGADAAMVESAAVLEEEPSAQQIRGLDGSLLGWPVITASGQRLGEVGGFDVNSTSGKIELYHIRPEAGLLARLTGLGKPEKVELLDALVVALGDSALIVRDEALSLFPSEAPAAGSSTGAPAS